MAIERTPFEVLETSGDFELRQYPGYIVAETEISGELGEAGSRAFPILAGYIFGKNKGNKKIAMTAPVTQSQGQKIAMTAPVTQSQGQKIAMTAPVTQSATGAGYRVQFMMPAEYSLATLPEPEDPRIELKLVEPRRMAAIRYSGTWSRENYDEHLSRLRAELSKRGLRASGEPVWARFDPPWVPWFLRHNEVMFPVE